jgi:hypothetical protein
MSHFPWRTARKRPCKLARSYKPRLEELERRELLTSAPTFTDVTTQAGILTTPANQELSINWADVNGDGLPDLWVGRHDASGIQVPNLYINQGNGTFVDQYKQTFPNIDVGDNHGSVWADFANAGQPTLFQTVGAARGHGTGPKHYWVNIGGHVIDEATAVGILDPLSRGRQPVVFDYNNDGLLDVLNVSALRPDGQAPSSLFAQTSTGFQDVTAAAGLSALGPTSGTFGEIANFNGTNDLSYFSGNQAPMFFSESNGVFSQIANMLPPDTLVSDMAVADFNNDGYLDAFLVTKQRNQSDVEQFSPTMIAANLKLIGHDQGFTFQTNGTITVDLETQVFQLNANQVFIGSSGLHPTGLSFQLDPTDSNNWGIQSHTNGKGSGLYIGYDTTNQIWTVEFSTQAVPIQGVVVNSPNAITGLTAIGFDPSQQFTHNYLLIYDPTTGTFKDETQQAGLGGLYSTGSVVAGDFTNDMHNDLVLTQETMIGSYADLYFHNNGDGTFTQTTLLPNAPPGPTGPINPAYEVAKKAITGDFNGDGALDLFINATNFFTTSASYQGNPNMLLENTPNSNHWIELNLQGTVSNRDGVGAMVRVTAGGVTQVQEETLGLHHFAQNSSTLHFGLAQNTKIDKIEIDWPDGTVQTLTNVSPDQIMTIVEPGGTKLAAPRPIPVYLGYGPYTGQVGTAKPSDYYRLTIGTATNLRIDLFNLTSSTNVRLLDASGNLLVQTTSSTSPQELFAAVNPGTYFVRVVSFHPTTNYDLRFSDESTSDTTGPTTSAVKATPNPNYTPPTISAWVDDSLTGNTKIIAAEYFIDSVGAVGTGTPMTATEGQFSGPIEYVTATLDATAYANLSEGTHTVYVRGEDAAGNWGATSSFTFTKDTPTHFHIDGPSPVTAGTAFTITVRVRDANNKNAVDYRGTIAFTSTDLAAVLPANYTFTAADAGQHTFTVTLNTAGLQSITATDTVVASLTGTRSAITVNGPTRPSPGGGVFGDGGDAFDAWGEGERRKG